MKIETKGPMMKMKKLVLTAEGDGDSASLTALFETMLKRGVHVTLLQAIAGVPIDPAPAKERAP